MNPAERAVLEHLVEQGCEEDFGYFGFAPICKATGLDRKVVRRACRSLARKGLTVFGRGLWSEDGEPGGSGYAATRNAHKVLSASIQAFSPVAHGTADLQASVVKP